MTNKISINYQQGKKNMYINNFFDVYKQGLPNIKLCIVIYGVISLEKIHFYL
jgi:hypothetical protein